MSVPDPGHQCCGAELVYRGIVRGRVVIPLVFVALLGASCRGSERLASDELPLPPSLHGGCTLQLMDAVSRGDLQAIASLRKRGAVGRCAETSRMLQFASRDQQWHRAEALLAAGAGFWATTPDTECPTAWQRLLQLRWAEPALLDPKLLGLLIQYQLDPNERLPASQHNEVRCSPPRPWGDAAGETPLMSASFIGDSVLVSVLIAHGARVDAKDAGGRTAFDYAAASPMELRRQDVLAMLKPADQDSRRR